jgi:hypothetical protein
MGTKRWRWPGSRRQPTDSLKLQLTHKHRLTHTPACWWVLPALCQGHATRWMLCTARGCAATTRTATPPTARPPAAPSCPSADPAGARAGAQPPQPWTPRAQHLHTCSVNAMASVKKEPSPGTGRRPVSCPVQGQLAQCRQSPLNLPRGCGSRRTQVHAARPPGPPAALRRSSASSSSWDRCSSRSSALAPSDRREAAAASRCTRTNKNSVS